MTVFCVIRGDFLLFFRLFQLLKGNAPVVTHRNTILFGNLLHMLDQFLASFLGQLGNRNADHFAVVARRQAEVGLKNRLFNFRHGATIKRLNYEQPWLRRAQRR